MRASNSATNSHTDSPNGCKWCGIEERSHYRRWKPPTGLHLWEAPTDEQRKNRMTTRRLATHCTYNTT